MTSGTEYAIKEFDVWDYSWLKWVFLAVVICYWFIFNVLSWLALCFVRSVDFIFENPINPLTLPTDMNQHLQRACKRVK